MLACLNACFVVFQWTRSMIQWKLFTMTLIYLVVSYGKLQLPAFLPMVFFFSPLAFNRSGTSKVERNPLHDDTVDLRVVQMKNCSRRNSFVFRRQSFKSCSDHIYLELWAPNFWIFELLGWKNLSDKQVSDQPPLMRSGEGPNEQLKHFNSLNTIIPNKKNRSCCWPPLTLRRSHTC